MAGTGIEQWLGKRASRSDKEETQKGGLWCPVSETESWISSWKRESEKDRIYPGDWNMTRLQQKLFLNKTPLIFIY